MAFCAAAIIQSSCTSETQHTSPLDRAEQFYTEGYYHDAQKLCDSLITVDRQSTMNVDELCRLSLLLMRLGDNTGDTDANTAFAARTLKSAIDRNADSVMTFLNSATVEDKARIAILTAITEARDTPVICDTTAYDY